MHPQARADAPLIKMLATGGTIAMKLDPDTGAPVPAISGEDLLQTVPGIADIARIEVDNISNIPSDHMQPANWLDIYAHTRKALARPEVTGVIITHGTDTLEETAYFLDLTLNSPKPVIVIGAQRNASSPDFDGPRNLLNAARVAVSEQAQGQGVMVVMNNQINAAREVSKSHTSEVESFQSGDFGFLGKADHDRVVFYRSPSRRQHIPLSTESLPRVDIVAMYAGADGTQIEAALAAGAKGIVVQAFGIGNVNRAVFAAIKQAIAQDVVVAISTRVPNGRVLPLYGFEGGGQTLKQAGALFADDLSPQKARILLMLALQEKKGTEGIFNDQ